MTTSTRLRQLLTLAAAAAFIGGLAGPAAATSPGAAAAPAAAAGPTTSQLGRFVATAPFRSYDTRIATQGPLVAGRDRIISFADTGAPVSGVQAVALNVTVTGGTDRGDLQIYPADTVPSKRTSNLNWKTGQTVAVGVDVGVDPLVQVVLSNSTGSVDVVIDVLGYYLDDPGPAVAPNGAGYTTLTPRRVLDTRTSSVPVRAGADRTVQLAGVNGVPADATSVLVNTTATGSTGNADVQLYPVGMRPEQRTSNLNLVRGQTIANAVTATVGEGGKIALSVSAGQVDLILDVVGYYSNDSLAVFTPVAPQRVLDTRNDRTPVKAGADRRLMLRGAGGVPDGARAAVLSVTATGASASTDLQVTPTGRAQGQRTSSVNVGRGQAVANLVLTSIGDDGSITLSNSKNSVDVIVDVLGYYDVP